MSGRFMTVCALALLAWLPASAGFAADADKSTANWPQWRGPNRDAVSEEKGLLQRWDGNGPPLAWKAAGLGEGLASVVLVDGKIFTMGRRKNAVLVMARDGSDGHELWATPVGEGGGDAPSSTPTVDGDRVFAVGPNGDLV